MLNEKDRLTIDHPTWGACIKGARVQVSGDCDKYDKAINRLASYENTGLTPEDIEQLKTSQTRVKVHYRDEELTVTELCKRLDALKQADMWIPISESLPEDNKWCLICIDGELLTGVFQYNAVYKKFTNTAFEITAGVTHWMQIPTPPEEAQR